MKHHLKKGRQTYQTQTPTIQPLTALDEVAKIKIPPLRVRRFILSSGAPDSVTILQHLDKFRRIYQTHGVVRLATVKLLDGLTNNDIDGQIERVFEFVKERMTYVRDPGRVEYVISPVRHLISVSRHGVTHGDCDDHVLLFNSMVGSIGVETRFVGVKLRSDRFNHVISSVLTKSGEWVDLDPCAKSSPQREYSERIVI